MEKFIFIIVCIVVTVILVKIACDSGDHAVFK